MANGSSQETVTQITPRKPTLRVPKRSKTSTISLQKKESQKRPSKSHRLIDVAPSYQILEATDCPALSVYEQADETLIIETGNYDLGQFATPLFLLRDSFVSCLGGISINRDVSISKPQADHLAMLFDFLVASAHESSAQAIMSKYQNAAHLAPSTRQVQTSRQSRHQTRVANDHKDKQTILYLFEENITMTTFIGAIHARILSARSYKAMITLGFELQYTGHQRLALSPFAINYMSHALADHDIIRGPYRSLSMYFLDLAYKGFFTANTPLRRGRKDKRLLWIPERFCGSEEVIASNQPYPYKMFKD